ncbi:hypothetical protein PQX77_006920 [Marasmius sp. AFHP31]|nr:hypothetical protein PQX77_006920 [Marasmius sp. AFHP31]
MTDLAHDTLTGKLSPKDTTVCLSLDFDFESADNAWDDANRATFSPASMGVHGGGGSRQCAIERSQMAMARLDTLVRMWGGNSGYGPGNEVNTLEGYLAFELKLGEYFFRHLNRVQQLLFAGNSRSPFGATEEGPWDDIEYDVALPRLGFLELHNIFISKRLADFILGEGAILDEVRLHDCDASTYDQEKISGAGFFTHLDRNKCQLRKLDVTYEQDGHAATIDEKEEFITRHDSRADEESRPKKENEKGRVFSYGMLYDKRGFFMADVEKIREKYKEGRDLDAFCNLMELVGSNVKDVARRYL